MWKCIISLYTSNLFLGCIIFITMTSSVHNASTIAHITMDRHIIFCLYNHDREVIRHVWYWHCTNPWYVFDRMCITWRHSFHPKNICLNKILCGVLFYSQHFAAVKFLYNFTHETIYYQQVYFILGHSYCGIPKYIGKSGGLASICTD